MLKGIKILMKLWNEQIIKINKKNSKLIEFIMKSMSLLFFWLFKEEIVRKFTKFIKNIGCIYYEIIN